MARLISDIRALVIGDRKVAVKDGTGTIGAGGKTNTPVMAGQDTIGFTQQGAAGTISITCAMEAGTSLDDFEAFNEDIRIQLDTGDEWLMRNAANTDPPEFSGGAGDVAVTYNGKKVQQTKKGS